MQSDKFRHIVELSEAVELYRNFRWTTFSAFHAFDPQCFRSAWMSGTSACIGSGTSGRRSGYVSMSGTWSSLGKHARRLHYRPRCQHMFPPTRHAVTWILTVASTFSWWLLLVTCFVLVRIARWSLLANPRFISLPLIRSAEDNILVSLAVHAIRMRVAKEDTGLGESLYRKERERKHTPDIDDIVKNMLRQWADEIFRKRISVAECFCHSLSWIAFLHLNMPTASFLDLHSDVQQGLPTAFIFWRITTSA